jgi:CubicO group peptidase (beta-lactamase class C family)
MRKTSFSTLDGSLVNPSGGAMSTADDYMQFLVMLLNKGNYKGKQILSVSSAELMMELQTNEVPIKSSPKAAEGYGYALGSWVLEQRPLTLEIPLNPKGAVPGPPAGSVERKTVIMSTALASPGLFGTWPMIDYCRGYAYIVFVKNLLGEEKADAHIELKKIIDEQLTSNCN